MVFSSYEILLRGKDVLQNSRVIDDLGVKVVQYPVSHFISIEYHPFVEVLEKKRQKTPNLEIVTPSGSSLVFMWSQNLGTLT